MTTLTGQHLGQYELTTLLGEGGMAAVYRAHRLNLKGDVAVKVIKTGLVGPDQMSEFVRRFQFEAETIAALSHPHILKLFDYGQHEDLVYLVTELLTGGTLAQLIRRAPLGMETVLRILDHVGSALDYAHEQGIVHRDLKPQNVLLDERGNAILTDFGLAKLMSDASEFTQSGISVGTPAYMAPEQWRGEPVTTRVDIYAFGAVLFEMLTGRLPFAADTPHSMMHMHLNERPPALRQLNSAIPEPVEAVVTMALAKEPDQRFESVAALVLAFKQAVQQSRTGPDVGAPVVIVSNPNLEDTAADINPSPRDILETPQAKPTLAVPARTKRAFISYAHPDQGFAEQLRKQLQEWHYDTWMDIHNIPKGAYWPNAIDEALQSADVILGLMSPDAVTSRNVRNEWDWALENEKTLLLLLVRECEHIPHRYISINYIEFIHNKKQGFVQLADALNLSAGTSPNRESPGTAMLKTAQSRPRSTNRSRMLQKVRDFWITGVLDNILDERKAFTLDLAFAAPGAVLKQVDRSDYDLPTSATIGDVFEDMNRELLILGQPGAGKTVLLLQLAAVLIGRAQADESQPIPVVFNLSSWAVNREPIETWLVNELRRNYQVPRKVAVAWVNNGELLPLLDGLDEVLAEFRDACIEALNLFRQEYSFVDMVVCSRIEDYEKLTHRLNLQSAINLQPLTQVQVDEHVQGPDLAGLRTLMKTDPTVQQMAQSPFLLNTMTFAYRGMTAAAQSGFNSEEERRIHLFRTYIERRFQHQEHAKTFSLKQIFSWLPALAHQMEQQGQSVFFIERIQPTWLPTPARRRTYIAVVGLVGTAIGGLGTALIMGSIGAITTTLHIGLVSGLIVGSVFGIAVGVFYALSAGSEDIQVAEALNWSWAKGGTGIVVGLVGALGGGLVYGIARHTSIFVPIGLTMGVAIGLAFGLTGGLVGSEVRLKTEPNQGIHLAARNAIGMALGFGLILAALIGVIFSAGFALSTHTNVDTSISLDISIVFGSTLGLASGLCFGLALALIRGGKTVVEHLVLRMLLYRSGAIPWNCSRFLDYAARLNILRRVGGGYIFVHRYLLEYFAALK